MQQNVLNVHDVIDAQKIGPAQLVIIALCGLVMLIDGFDTQAISYVAPKLAEEWHLSRDAIGPIFSSALVGSVIGYCLVSLLSAYVGHKRMLVIDTVIFCISICATVFATDMTELLTLRFITGMALGAVIPSVIALACEYSPGRRRATCVLVIYCCYSLGFVAAGIAAGTVMTVYGWRSLFWIGSAAPFVLLGIVILRMPESLAFLSQQSQSKDHLSSIMHRLYPNHPTFTGATFESRQIRSERGGVLGLFAGRAAFGTVLLWLIYFINVAIFYFLQSWLPTMLANLHYTQTQAVWITALTTVGGALSVFVIGPAMDRFGPYRVLAALFLIGGVFVAGVGYALQLPAWALMAATFCAGFCVSGAMKSVIALSALFYRADLRSTGVGWALGIGRIGGAAGPMLVGMMYATHWATNDIFYLAAVPLLLAASSVLVMFAFYRQPSRSAPLGANFIAPI